MSDLNHQLIEDLERLAKLKQDGVLSEHEFDTAKTKLLASQEVDNNPRTSHSEDHPNEIPIWRRILGEESPAQNRRQVLNGFDAMFVRSARLMADAVNGIRKLTTSGKVILFGSVCFIILIIATLISTNHSETATTLSVVNTPQTSSNLITDIPPPPPPPQAPKQLSLQDAIDSAINAYAEQWERIRKAPDEATGKSYTWIAKVRSIWGEWVTIGDYQKGVVYNVDTSIELPKPKTWDEAMTELSGNLGVVSRGLPEVHEGDIVRLIGTFNGVTSNGDLEFDPKTLKNYGYR